MVEGASWFGAALLPQGLDGKINSQIYQDILQENVRQLKLDRSCECNRTKTQNTEVNQQQNGFNRRRIYRWGEWILLPSLSPFSSSVDPQKCRNPGFSKGFTFFFLPLYVYPQLIERGLRGTAHTIQIIGLFVCSFGVCSVFRFLYVMEEVSGVDGGAPGDSQRHRV